MEPNTGKTQKLPPLAEHGKATNTPSRVPKASNAEVRRSRDTLNHRQRYATTDELDWIAKTAETLPSDGLVIILGAGPGVMLAAVKDGNPNIHVFMVDIDTCEYAIRHMSEFGPEYQENVFGMVGDSAAVGTRYEGRMADLLIVDADHTKQGVYADLVCWLGHVKPDSPVFVHDYDAKGTWFENQEQYPGVKEAADLLLANFARPDPSRVGTAALYLNRVIRPEWDAFSGNISE